MFLISCSNSKEPNFSVSRMSTDHDLKEVILSLARRAQSMGVLGSVMKVRSHMNIEAFSHTVERWAIRGNDFADKCAEQARTGFHPSFWRLWEQAASRLHYIREIRRELHSLFTEVGAQAVSLKNVVWERDEQIHEPMEQQVSLDEEVQLQFSWRKYLRAIWFWGVVGERLQISWQYGTGGFSVDVATGVPARWGSCTMGKSSSTSGFVSSSNWTVGGQTFLCQTNICRADKIGRRFFLEGSGAWFWNLFTSCFKGSGHGVHTVQATSGRFCNPMPSKLHIHPDSTFEDFLHGWSFYETTAGSNQRC